jgi:uncharacterized membrane protein YraQ (UPF0718 family)
MLTEGIEKGVGLFLEGKTAEVVSFFLVDTIKIIFILWLMIAAIGILRTYLPKEKVKKYLTHHKGIVGNVVASFFGAITPFCSCSSIPIFLGFVQSGVPSGISFSFLITSPLVNQYLVVLMLGYFGWKITLAYIVIGMLVGILGGIVIGKLGVSKYIVKDVKGKDVSEKYSNFSDRVKFGLHEAFSITKKLWVWILIGVGIGAIIHNYVPSETIQTAVEAGGVLGVPLAVLLGVPIYGSCAAIVPIAIVLFQKGMPLGTALAFMMATAALSLPEAIILRRALKIQLIAIFFGIVTVGIIIAGYGMNLASFLLG